MRPTRWWTLLLLAAAAAAIAYLLTAAFYARMASPPGYAPVSLLLLAVAEAYTAALTRARLAGRAGTRPINPLVAARLAALAKASSPVGALALGLYAGFLVHVARQAGPVAANDTRTAAIGTGAGVALVLAALALERVCRVKRPPDDEPPGGSELGSRHA